MTFDTSGDLYGTCQVGGANNDGMVWEVTAKGVYKDLHDFGGLDGTHPSGVTLDSHGNLYGVCLTGGALATASIQGGVAWEMTKAGVFKDLHDFGGP